MGKQKKKELECHIHGLTTFIRVHDRGYTYWQCLRCRMDANNKFRKKRKLTLVQHAGGECSVCGYKENLSALEFHHLDPSKKDFSVARMQRNLKELLQEIDKCILLCANCHREVHFPEWSKEAVEWL